MQITRGQLAKIFVLANENGIDNELLHELVKSRFNLNSLKKLTSVQAGKLIEYLGGTTAFSQENYIRKLEKDIGWGDNPARLEGFIQGMFKKRSLSKLTKKEKSKLIETLKSMKARGYSERTK